MSDWTIRRATAEDAEALARCIERAYAIYDGRDLDLPPVSEGIAEHIAAHRVWVAEAEGTIAGGLVLIVGDDAMGHGTTDGGKMGGGTTGSGSIVEQAAHLANVAVDPNFTGRGLGRALIAQAEEDARAHGATELRLTTHADLEENIRLYTRLGWHEVGRDGYRVHMAKGV